MKEPNHRHRGLLRARRERPGGRAAEQRDELAPLELSAHSITSSARNTIDSGTVRAGALAFLAFSAVIVSIGKFPSPGSEPERVFTSGQPAIADEILNVERRCFTASSRSWTRNCSPFTALPIWRIATAC